MTPYFLDTDIVSLLQFGHPTIARRVESATDVAITVITVEEVLTGWYTSARKATRPARLEEAYTRLSAAVRLLGAFRIENFTQAAMARFERLNKQKLNVKANDLRIAAIALEAGAVVVTHNVRDFARVPGLTVEDWATDPTPPPRPPAG